MERELTVLVVDDEQIILDSVRKHLRKGNFAVKTVLTAQEAVDSFRCDTIDIVLTDLMMPEMDGLELMAEMMQHCPDVPVIMITGYATIESARQANQLGAFDYLPKPFTRAELKDVLKRAADYVYAADKSSETSDTKQSQRD